MPEAFRRLVCSHEPEGGVEGADWLAGLPRLVEECLTRWDLAVDGSSRHGMAALVVPVRRTDGSPAVLKLTWPHPEAAQEHLALRRWGGGGAVRLLAADPSRWALLLERLDADRDLSGVPIEQACRVIGGLLAQLDVPALPGSTRLSGEARRWATQLADAPDVIPRRLLDQARGLALELVQLPGVDAGLVHTDLHYENVLAGQRQPWLAIDPKPLAGEPACAVAPALWNRFPEAVASGNLRRDLRRRLAVICDAAGIDPERARGWTVVREAVNALWEARSPDRRTASVLTAKVATIKAMLE